jgi:catechol 2,3-dioxygenase-like lactoylglutathione lyase family enzyme
MADDENDLGLSHLALVVHDLDASIDFYRRYAGMRVVHERDDDGVRIAWVSDLTRPFAIVLAQGPGVEHPLGPFAHLGVGAPSRAEVDRLAALAHAEGRLALGPTDGGPPIGYFALLTDPDGHTLELAYGQQVSLTIDRSRDEAARTDEVPEELLAATRAEIEYPGDDTDEG